RRANELSLYYTAYDVTHGGYAKRDNLGGVITRALYRLDGFMSAEAGYEGGEFTTPLLTFSGDRLELNLDGSAGGWCRVELRVRNALPGRLTQDGRERHVCAARIPGVERRNLSRLLSLAGCPGQQSLPGSSLALDRRRGHLAQPGRASELRLLLRRDPRRRRLGDRLLERSADATSAALHVEPPRPSGGSRDPAV